MKRAGGGLMKSGSLRQPVDACRTRAADAAPCGRRSAGAHPPDRHVRHRLPYLRAATSRSLATPASWGTSWRAKWSQAPTGSRFVVGQIGDDQPLSVVRHLHRVPQGQAQLLHRDPGARRASRRRHVRVPRACPKRRVDRRPTGLSLDQAAMVEFLAIGAHAVAPRPTVGRATRAGDRRRPDRGRHGAVRAGSPAPR